MKEIKDYLPLYPKVPILICEPGIEPVSHYLEGYDWYLGKAIAERVSYDPSWIKPILRPLSSMTEEETEHVANMCYHSVFDNAPEFENKVFPDDPDLEAAGMIAFEQGEKFRYGLTIDWYGVRFSVNGSDMRIKTYEIVGYLLSRSFDLFGLIDAGLAIDSTKQ